MKERLSPSHFVSRDPERCRRKTPARGRRKPSMSAGAHGDWIREDRGGQAEGSWGHGGEFRSSSQHSGSTAGFGVVRGIN